MTSDSCSSSGCVCRFVVGAPVPSLLSREGTIGSPAFLAFLAGRSSTFILGIISAALEGPEKDIDVVISLGRRGRIALGGRGGSEPMLLLIFGDDEALLRMLLAWVFEAID